MKILFIGGTIFAGRHITDVLVKRGHAVTQFNRGRTEPTRRADVEVVHGDRATDLDRLGTQRWDAVIDTCGYTPDTVAASVKYVRDAGGYLFVSSVSAYAGDPPPNAAIDEDLPLAPMPQQADASKITAETYGPLKALCEQEVRAVFGERATILRPGLIAGPFDRSDRFTYWPVRIAAGGDVLVPGGPSHSLQYIDVRDLADFVATMVEANRGGAYNVVTTPQSRTFGELIDACAAASASGARAIWGDAEFLAHHDVTPWTDLPLWIPTSDPFYRFIATSNGRARDAGLRLRPLAETVQDTLGWAASAGKRYGSLSVGLKPEREAELLAGLRTIAP